MSPHGPDFATLDANLSKLIKRAYVPVVPRAHFRRAMIQMAREEAVRHGVYVPARRPRSTPRLAWALVPIAAALAVWFGMQFLGAGGTGVSPDAPDDGTLVDNGADSGAGTGPSGVDGPGERGPAPEPRGGETELLTPEDQIAGGDRRTVEPGSDTDDSGPDANAEGGEGAPPDEDIPGAAFEGSVTGPDGAPVTSFRVIVLAQREVPDVVLPTLRAFDSADGSFRWDGLDADRYEVFVEADGFAQVRRGPIELEDDAEFALDVSLVRGRTLRGWVIDDETEAPIPGATIVIESETPSQVLPLDMDEMPEWLSRSAETSTDGAFAVPSLSAGRHRVRVFARGYAPLWVSVDAAPVTADDAAGELVVPNAAERIIRLGKGGGLKGTVTDGFGQPVAGAVVMATIGEDPMNVRLFSYETDLTDAEGRFGFQHLAPGFYMLVQWPSEAEFEGGGVPTLRPAFVSAGKTITIDFKGEAGVIDVTGRITDHTGEPQVYQKLTLLPVEANEPGGSEDWTASAADTEGRFHFQITRPGHYLLFATFGMGERLVLIDEFEVPEGRTELTRDVTILPTSAELTVTRAEDHTPVPHATVAILRRMPDGDMKFSGRAITDGNGFTALNGLRPGTYAAVAESMNATDLAQGISEPFEISADDIAEPRQVRLELRPGGALRIQVTDGTNPVGGARVSLSSEEIRAVMTLTDPVTDGDGALELLGLAPGLYTVHVEARGFQPATSTAEVRAVRGGDITLSLTPVD